MIGVINTVKGAAFIDWVTSLLEERDKVYMDKKNQYIEIDPKIKAIFEKVKHTSGKSPKLFLGHNFG